MKPKALSWMGTRTDKFEATSSFFRDTLGLDTAHEEPDFAVYRLPNGDAVEVFGPSDRTHQHFETGPVVGFLVDDVEQARSELEAAGVSFIGPVHTADDGGSWSHFRGPDGNVYELTGEKEEDHAEHTNPT